MFESAERSVAEGSVNATAFTRQGRNLNLGHADHGIPPHERRQLLFAPVAGFRRSFRENQVTNLRAAIPHSYFDRVIEFQAEFLQHAPGIDDDTGAIGQALIPGRRQAQNNVYTFTKTTGWVKFHQVKQDVMLKVSSIIEANGAEIAFPTSTLHISGPVELENSRA